jgi:hypothetical protein
MHDRVELDLPLTLSRKRRARDDKSFAGLMEKDLLQALHADFYSTRPLGESHAPDAAL